MFILVLLLTQEISRNLFVNFWNLSTEISKNFRTHNLSQLYRCAWRSAAFILRLPACGMVHYNSHRSQIHTHMHVHTHTRLMDLCLGLSECASAPIWILLKQETVSGKSDNKYNIMEWSVVFIVVRLRKRKRSLRVALSQSAIWNSNVILQLIKSNMWVSICTEWTLLSVHNHWHLAGLLTIVIQFIEDIQMLCHWHTM